VLDKYSVHANTIDMLNQSPLFETYFAAYLRDDAAQEPLAVSHSATDVLAQAESRTGRTKANFKLRQIDKEQYEILKKLIG
jgi:hypothetical protein